MARPVGKLDEAQDANPVTAAVIQGQDMQKIAVGDSCQAIYGWRGAVDALADWPADLRLYLSRSFRFGAAVADEANKWLRVLGAPFMLAGDSRITSAIGPVDKPHAVVCRTNAEALLQARTALDAGRRVALAGGGQEVRQLAHAALELKASGRTAHPELAAFRTWDAVRAFVRTDTAGADLAASVWLIDKHGAAQVLATVDKLSGPRRADLIVSTVHRAKGLEWDSVRVAGDFRPVRAGDPVARAEAMLGYVAVTRARTGLDQAGLAWIDNHTSQAPVTRAAAAGTITKEITMNQTEFDVGFGEDSSSQGLLDGDAHVVAKPYAGGRAQAESGSAIIESDYYRWLATALETPGLSPTHPRIVQLGEAWRAVSKHGLGDDPGAASVRYLVLAHAAGALAEPVRGEGLGSEAGALLSLRQHSLIHEGRLYATSIELFTRSGKSRRYSGRGQAAAGSRIVETDYRNWIRTPAAASASGDPAVREYVGVLQQAWGQVERRGLDDGPERAAARYQAISGIARNLAQDFSYRLPSAALIPLLTLAQHADKHSMRLRSGAVARNNDTATGYEALRQATGERSVGGGRAAPYRGLPAQVATTATRAHAESPHGGGLAASAVNSPARQVTRKRAAQNERG